MVFFCCDGCGETFKKAKVDAHAAKCRECYSVSCVDCSLSFFGDDYRNHTSCITEAERYEKTIYRGTRKLDESGTGHGNGQQRGKKLTPQEAWNQTIQIAAETAPSSLKSYMDQLAMLENVPRKEKQFRNFTVNSLRLRGPNGEKAKGDIWALLTKVREDEKRRKEEEDKQKKQQQAKPTPKGEETVLPDSFETERTNAAISVSDDEPSNTDNSNKDSPPDPDLPSEKAVTKAMKKVLKKAPQKQLKFKYLRKEVQESLSFKAGKNGKKKWKKLLKECVDANPKKLVMDGKIVSLS
mmetsp:Transcript_4216/g.10726  ORF Transcript_4216/g.10726 Transcript_4216/m.10726 type:complete len:296 (-) Transcript_4216:40-927(-)